MKKIIVYGPLTHADQVRKAIGEAGGGKLGKYSFCSFSTRGIGRFRPDEGANPHIGHAGRLEEVEEDKIEITCDDKVLKDVLSAIKKVHPYEEIALDIFDILPA